MTDAPDDLAGLKAELRGAFALPIVRLRAIAAIDSLQRQLSEARAELHATVRKLNCDDAAAFWAWVEKMRQRADTAERQLSASRAAEERMRAALEPFAKRADYFDAKIKANGDRWRDEDAYCDDPPSDIYLAQLRAARVASSPPSRS